MCILQYKVCAEMRAELKSMYQNGPIFKCAEMRAEMCGNRLYNYTKHKATAVRKWRAFLSIEKAPSFPYGLSVSRLEVKNMIDLPHRDQIGW